MQTVIALGFFDGVHLGHGDLLARTAAVAAERGWRSAALTFDRSPGKDGRLLTTVEDRIRLIRGLYGVDEVFVLTFSEEFRRMDWERFLESLVRDRAAAHFVCGWDYRFGYLGKGTPELLRQWCEARGLGCDVIPPRVIEGVTVSSSYIKTLIQAGDAEGAARFYGHPHSLTGTAQSGRGLGHTLGFPTANLLPAPELVLPRDGVYAVQVTVYGSGKSGQSMPVPTGAGAVAHTVRRYSGEAQTYLGVCNVGTRPTVGGHRRTVETWLSGFDGDLYGRTLTVEFYCRLRDEKSFPSLEALKEEIFRNQAQAEAYFRIKLNDKSGFF